MKRRSVVIMLLALLALSGCGRGDTSSVVKDLPPVETAAPTPDGDVASTPASVPVADVAVSDLTPVGSAPEYVFGDYLYDVTDMDVSVLFSSDTKVYTDVDGGLHKVPNAVSIEYVVPFVPLQEGDLREGVVDLSGLDGDVFHVAMVGRVSKPSTMDAFVSAQSDAWYMDGDGRLHFKYVPGSGAALGSRMQVSVIASADDLCGNLTFPSPASLLASEEAYVYYGDERESSVSADLSFTVILSDRTPMLEHLSRPVALGLDTVAVLHGYDNSGLLWDGDPDTHYGEDEWDVCSYTYAARGSYESAVREGVYGLSIMELFGDKVSIDFSYAEEPVGSDVPEGL